MPSTKNSKCFLHLSDIHFGQEKSGSQIVWHDDVKDQVIRRVRDIAGERKVGGHSPIAGVLVTGDIAYAGKANEYAKAAAWLRQVTDAAGCCETDVQVVPGNHDIDRDQISYSARLLLDDILAKGTPALDACLANETDSEILYKRFQEYRLFGAAYGCELNQAGGRAGEKRFDLGSGRMMSISGLNSALLCKRKDKPGELILGARQHVFQEEEGVAHVVLSHHPLNWFSDESQSKSYLQNRTCVLLSGHEHQPKHEIVEIAGEPRFLWVAAGALIPPAGEDGYTYTFNVLEFGVSDDGKNLTLGVKPYSWNAESVSFEEDHQRFDGADVARAFEIRCRSFDLKGSDLSCAARPARPDPKEENTELQASAAIDPRFPQLRLHFFQKLGAVQRLRVLDDLGLIPPGITSIPNLTMERMALEAASCDSAKVDRLAQALAAQLNSSEGR